MDLPQIDKNVLHAIFVDLSAFRPAMVREIAEWNSAVEPSFGVVRALLTTFLNEHRLQALKDVQPRILALQQAKCPKNFMRAYFSFLGEASPDPPIDWTRIQAQLLESFCAAFHLTEFVGVEQRVRELTDAKRYPQAMLVLKQTQHLHLADYLLERMANNKLASKAADYIAALNLNPKNYPEVGMRLSKNTTRHFLTHHGWAHAQDIFSQCPQALAIVVEDLVFKDLRAEAKSIATRNPALLPFIVKEETKAALSALPPLPLLQNPLFASYFGPSSQKYLSLQELSLKEEDVVWVRDVEAAGREILSSSIVGVDTESVVGLTKFERGPQSAAVIQIATPHRVFLFDGLKVEEGVRGLFRELLSRKDIKKVGHALINDLKLLSDCQPRNVVDVWVLFKAVFPQERHSSLAFICLRLLKKECCKEQTLTNWKKRPLRRNQIHYAALDASVVLTIYAQLARLCGPQLLAYYEDQ